MKMPTLPQKIAELQNLANNDKILKHKAGTQWVVGVNDRRDTLNALHSVLGETVDGFHIQRSLNEPEAMLAMAHAESISTNAVSSMRSKGLYPIALDTEAIVSSNGFSILAIHLSVTGFVRGITAVGFYTLIMEAIKNCPITKVLSIPITSEVVLSLETGFS